MNFKLFVAAAAFAATMTAAPIVQYTTTGVFTSSGTNVSTAASGLSQVQFLAGSGGPIDLAFGTANVSFGQFELTSTRASGFDTFDDTFTLTIAQTSPVAGSEDFNATLTGNVRFNFTNAQVQFTLLDAVIGGVQYHIASAGNSVPGRVLIPTPTVDSGVGRSTATLEGQISAVPEPGTWALMSMGLALVGWGTRRKRA